MPIVLKALKPKQTDFEPQTLGEHIRKRRIELGLSQPKAAERLAVSAATVLNWEKGKRTPLATQLGAVISFLGHYPFEQPTTVCECLLKKRRENGWTTNEAARQLGVDRTTWQDWERGGVILYRKHRTMVAAFLGLDPKELVDAMRARWNGKHRRWECTDLPPGTGPDSGIPPSKARDTGSPTSSKSNPNG